VLVDHGNGWEQRYAHLSAVLVERGDKVNTGEYIGRTGRTDIPPGAAPHLHQELRLRGQPVDPRTVVDLDLGD
jgi:murein DD-endopeptidase MepM/ murein hydrolase activator NlpD